MTSNYEQKEMEAKEMKKEIATQKDNLSKKDSDIVGLKDVMKKLQPGANEEQKLGAE